MNRATLLHYLLGGLLFGGIVGALASASFAGGLAALGLLSLLLLPVVIFFTISYIIGKRKRSEPQGWLSIPSSSDSPPR